VFRAGFFACLAARSDALFELSDALLCSSGPVTSLPVLSLAGVFRRGHGALYDALAAGRIDADRLRGLLGASGSAASAAGSCSRSMPLDGFARTRTAPRGACTAT
jgi:hypothetical protein